MQAEGNMVQKMREEFEENWRLGNAAEAERDHRQSRSYYDKAFALAEAIVAETGAAEDRCILATSYEMLGSGALKWNKRASAKYYYTKSLAHREAVAKQTGTVEARRALAAAYKRLGRIAADAKDPSGSIRYLTQCLELEEEIAEQTGAIADRRAIAETYENLGDVAESMRESQMGYYRKMHELRKAIFEESKTYDSYREYEIALAIMAQISSNSAERRGYLLEEYEIMRQHVERYPDDILLQNLLNGVIQQIQSIQ
ncbi:MAG: hypothetical protein LUH51_00390 [Firmicutes bacterium]|nr:hypothetical protein [Bacillota bacterium]